MSDARELVDKAKDALATIEVDNLDPSERIAYAKTLASIASAQGAIYAAELTEIVAAELSRCKDQLVRVADRIDPPKPAGAHTPAPEASHPARCPVGPSHLRGTAISSRRANRGAYKTVAMCHLLGLRSGI